VKGVLGGGKRSLQREWCERASHRRSLQLRRYPLCLYIQGVGQSFTKREKSNLETKNEKGGVKRMEDLVLRYISGARYPLIVRIKEKKEKKEREEELGKEVKEIGE
jgi:hypothetical protein